MGGESWLQLSRLGTWGPTFYVNACFLVIVLFVYLGGGSVWNFVVFCFIVLLLG